MALFEDSDVGAEVEDLEAVVPRVVLPPQDDHVEIFLDSGAFSVHTGRATITVDDYAAFVHEHMADLYVYANLDVLQDPEATWENQKALESLGLAPLPTYHMGEDPRYLTRYLDAGYPYVSIGNLVGQPGNALAEFLDETFSRYLCDAAGNVQVDVHGFGVGGPELVLRYPWASCDASSWLLVSRFGGILIWYNDQPVKVVVSRDNVKALAGGRHYDGLPAAAKRVVADTVERCGLTMDEVCGHYTARDVVNIQFFIELERRAERRPFKLAQGKLF